MMIEMRMMVVRRKGDALFLKRVIKMRFFFLPRSVLRDKLGEMIDGRRTLFKCVSFRFRSNIVEVL